MMEENKPVGSPTNKEYNLTINQNNNMEDSQITFKLHENEYVPSIEFRNNGDIFIKGRLVENDKMVVQGIRDFLIQSGAIERQTEPMKNKLKDFTIQMFCTRIGWFIISAFLFILFGCLSTNNTFGFKGFEWANYALLFPCAVLAYLTVEMCVHMVINLFKNKNK